MNDNPTPAPKKQSDDKVIKVLIGVVFFVFLAGLPFLLGLLPFCSKSGVNGLTMLAIVCVPIVACLSVLAASVGYNLLKKIPEKRVEMESQDEVPVGVLARILMTAYTVSLIITAIPSYIFTSIFRSSCEKAEFTGCGSEANIPYFALFFPLTVAVAVFAGYKIAYLLFVPLSEGGRYPNGNPIMRHVAPKWTRFATFGASALAVIILLIATILFINSF